MNYHPIPKYNSFTLRNFGNILHKYLFLECLLQSRDIEAKNGVFIGHCNFSPS